MRVVSGECDGRIRPKEEMRVSGGMSHEEPGASAQELTGRVPHNNHSVLSSLATLSGSDQRILLQPATSVRVLTSTEVLFISSEKELGLATETKACS